MKKLLLKKLLRQLGLTALLLPILHHLSASAQNRQPLQWPEITQEAKPWTRWWWMGSAVDEKNLTHLLEQYQQAGLGGVEITPIYGVKGTEQQFIDFLSPKWMQMLKHTLQESKRLGMGVDMAQASGWPFGGPWVTPEDACKYITHTTYTLKGGESLQEPVRFVQKPILRIIGKKVDISELKEPVTENPNLQELAIDQVRFERPLPLQVLMAYSDKGQVLDLTSKVDQNGKLNWKAPAGNWTLYAAFQGWHGKMVERAGPGGEGDVIDHFSAKATRNYLQHFDKAFQGHDISGIRAFFNDSYEVDDAVGESNWTPQLFAEFQKRRGYDLRHHLPALFGKASEEQNQRVLSDYRETISDLVLENYTQLWSDWAKTKGTKIRNQAHGSPANILDLYAITDIPEIEGTDLLRIKFASSAANVTGKKLTSSESATWNNEHFLSTLSSVKKAMDLFLLGGVNHTFYHGTNYSPQEAEFPGWLFYAAVHFNPNNTFWKDFSALNQYVARCQSFLQQGRPSNDVLLYLPIYDVYATPNRAGLLQHFDGISHGFKGMPVEQNAQEMLQKGYGFDFISDRQLLNVKNDGKALQTGGNNYQTVVVPGAKFLPTATLEKLVQLAQEGATVVFFNSLPTSAPGLSQRQEQEAGYRKLIAQLQFNEAAGLKKATVGKGAILVGENLDQLLVQAGVQRESMVDKGLQFVRRQHDNGHHYFVANWGETPVNGWVTLQSEAQAVAMYNPMKGHTGYASTRSGEKGGTQVYVQLAPGESCILETSRTAASGAAYAYHQPTGDAQTLQGTWTVKFQEGGPKLPADVKIKELKSWTEFGGEDVKNFSGTATYSLTFKKPKGGAENYLLDLGKVAESARVTLNGTDLGTLIGPTFQVLVPQELLKRKNTLEVAVSNLMANRVANLDRRGVVWQKFYNINMSARRRENASPQGYFTAAKWDPLPSGLFGPVTLTPVKVQDAPKEPVSSMR